MENNGVETLEPELPEIHANFKFRSIGIHWN